MTGRGRPAESGPLDGEGRRSVYTSIRRNFLPPFMLVFDMPIPFSTFGKRNVTNVPAQSLTLLNDPFVHQQAGEWAQEVIGAPLNSDRERVELIYLKALSRKPDTTEIERAIEFIKSGEAGSELQTWTEYCHTVYT